MTYALSQLHPTARGTVNCCASLPLLVIDLITCAVMMGLGAHALTSYSSAISNQAAVALIATGGSFLALDAIIASVKIRMAD